MHARYYASASGRFCTADANLGCASDPLTLNRYLYCSSDPVNFVDPDGFASALLKLGRKGKSVVNFRKAKSSFPGYDPAAQKGQANLDERWRDYNMLSGTLKLTMNELLARAIAWPNTVRLNQEAAARIEQKYGWAAREAYCKMVAQRYQKQLEAYSCGTAEHMREVGASMHAFASLADEHHLVTIATLTDWCAYVAEGDAGMSAVYTVASLLAVNPGSSGGGSAGSISLKVGSKVVIGSGFKQRLSASLIFSNNKKSAERLARQMEKRGWTKESVGDLVDDPFTKRKATNKARGNPATAYYDEKGNYVVVDDVTNEVVQISDKNKHWDPDKTIVDPYMPNRNGD